MADKYTVIRTDELSGTKQPADLLSVRVYDGDEYIAVENGTIVIATVQGDIHDIGKNIVRAVLENYGYRIIDLGRDVAPAAVVEAVEKSSAALCGLSALMTTTLPAMETTIKLLADRCPVCKVVVGGAVLTADYAEKIGAHFYAKDAAATVAAAKQVFGK